MRQKIGAKAIIHVQFTWRGETGNAVHVFAIVIMFKVSGMAM